MKPIRVKELKTLRVKHIRSGKIFRAIKWNGSDDLFQKLKSRFPSWSIRRYGDRMVITDRRLGCGYIPQTIGYEPSQIRLYIDLFDWFVFELASPYAVVTFHLDRYPAAAFREEEFWEEFEEIEEESEEE